MFAKVKADILKILILFIVFFNSLAVFSQTKEEISKITENYDKEKILAKAAERKVEHDQKRAKAYEYALANDLPTRYETEDGNIIELQYMNGSGELVYYQTNNEVCASVTNAEEFYPGGSLGLNIQGQGMRAFVWDSGTCRDTHNAFEGRATLKDNVGHTSHATHVTGTIIATGDDAKGMAPEAEVDSYKWDSDIAEASAATVMDGMLLSNHSYNSSVYSSSVFGRYLNKSREWDDVMHDAPNYLMVVSAGNNGNNNTINSSPLQGNVYFDKLIGHSTAKNNLVVANAGLSLFTGLYRNSSSSEGPTDDFRIKPDITGYGTNVFSTNNGGDNDYSYKTGTSMASPNVMGSLLLLQQFYKEETGNFARASTIKGLALHTAVDHGLSGPDAEWGWGVLDAEAAANVIKDNGSQSLAKELNLPQGGTFYMLVKGIGQPLSASICWTDPPGQPQFGTNSSTPVLVNDLDIRVIEQFGAQTTHYPYKLTGVNTNAQGDNLVDPFERVDVDPQTAGFYLIEVSHKGTLNGSNQVFSLVITGADIVYDPVQVPYSHGFEASYNLAQNVEGWQDVGGDNFNWTRNSGGTPSWSTGPSSSYGGNYYIYMEASSPNNPYKTARTISPFINLIGAPSQTTFSFRYHMLGNSMGELKLEVSDDGGSSWDQLWVKSGNQGNQWKEGIVSLGAYAGKVIRLRFTGTTGSGYQGDIALDRIKIISNYNDVIPPTTPGWASPTNITANSATLNWLASTDNVAVDKYIVHGPNFYTQTQSLSVPLTNLPSAQSQFFFVRAIDTSGNLSNAQSFSVTTLASGGPIGYYPFDYNLENLGSSGVDAISNGPLYYSPNTAITGGYFNGNYAYDFNHTNVNYLNLSNSGSYLKDAFDERTVAFWIKPTLGSSAVYQILYKEGNLNDGIEIGLKNNSILRFRIKGSNHPSYYPYAFTYSHPIHISQTEWTHIGYTFKGGGAIKMYKDGSEIYGISGIAPFSVEYHGEGGYLGGTPQGTASYGSNTTANHFEGKMDEAHIYNRELSQAEICDLASAYCNGSITNSTSASIETSHNEYELKLYPNPGQDIINLRADSPLKLIKLMDGSGRVIRYIESGLEEELLTIDISFAVFSNVFC